jgi:ATP-dependent Zn proteases
LDTHDPVYKVSIIPRGRALGVTIYTSESDRVSYSREEIKASIATLYGGRIAEAMMVGEEKTTTGASNDIERATELAYNYVTKWGLDGHSLIKNDSKVNGIGPVYYSKHEKHIDGRERLLSDHDLETIDLRVRKLLDECYAEACKILEGYKEELVIMHNMLIEKETIDAEDVHLIMDNKTIFKTIIFPATYGSFLFPIML